MTASPSRPGNTGGFNHYIPGDPRPAYGTGAW